MRHKIYNTSRINLAGADIQFSTQTGDAVYVARGRFIKEREGGIA